MKKILLLLSATLLFSCSVQKRKYQKGFHVEWSKSNTAPREKRAELSQHKVSKKTIDPSETTSPALAEPVLLASGETQLSGAELKKIPFTIQTNDSCDVLIFKDGSEISGKVTEISPTEIKYKKCGMPDGPVYVAKKSDMFMIKYGNGTREVFRDETRTNPSAPSQNPRQNNYQGPRQTHPLAIVALVFSVLGYFPLFLLGSIIGAVLANQAARKINAQPNIYRGDTLVAIARVLSYIVIGLMALVLLFLLIGLLLTI